MVSSGCGGRTFFFFLQGQQSMNLTELSYVRYETGAGGWFDPAYLVLDLHFFNYPTELAPTLVRARACVVVGWSDFELNEIDRVCLQTNSDATR
jgi:hypothetical protein